MAVRSRASPKAGARRTTPAPGRSGAAPTATTLTTAARTSHSATCRRRARRTRVRELEPARPQREVELHAQAHEQVTLDAARAGQRAELEAVAEAQARGAAQQRADAAVHADAGAQRK